MAPVLEQLCAENRTTLKVVKVDASENFDTAASHRIRRVPTFVLYHAGNVLGEMSGVQSKESFKKWITELVPGVSMA